MEYEKEQIIYETTDKEKNFQLIQTILKTERDLAKAHLNFDYAEEDLIDFYTYQIKALQAKLDYLTKLAKSNDIDFNLFNEKAV